MLFSSILTSVNKLRPNAASFSVRNVRIETACSMVSQGFESSVYTLFIKYCNLLNSNSLILMYWPNYLQLYARYLHSPRGLRSGSACFSLAGIAGSNPAGGMELVSCYCSVLWGLRRADYSSRGVLLCAVRCVWSRTLTNVELLVLIGPVSHKINTYTWCANRCG